MIGHAGKIGVGESDSAKRSRTEHVSGGGLPILAEEESRRRTQIGVPPPVQNDSGDVAPGVKARAREHFAELLANLALVLPERRGKQFGSPRVSLLFGGLAGIGI